MKKLGFAFIALLLGSCAQADPDSYRCTESMFGGETSAVCWDTSTKDVHLFSNDTSVLEITTAGELDLPLAATLTLQNDEYIDNTTDDFICVAGSGGTSDEDLCFDVDGTNEVRVTTNTGVTVVDFETINLETDQISANDTGTLTVLVNSEDLVFTGATNQINVSTGTSTATVDFGSINLATDALDLSEGNIANVGDVQLDSLTADAAGGIGLNGTTLTSGGTDDYGVKLTHTLNDTGAAGGSDDYTAIDVAITTTDVTGWDTTYFVKMLDDATVVFSVAFAGLDILKFQEADLSAGACTAGTTRVDSATTRELCICNAAGTAYDCWSVTTANGPSD